MEIRYLLLLIVCLSHSCAQETPVCKYPIPEPLNVRVFITISSLAFVTNNSNIIDRQIELNWYNAKPVENDTVALFDTDPHVNRTQPLASTLVAHRQQGFFRTAVMFPRPHFATAKIKQRCLGFWVGYVRNDTILALDCLKIQPHWMWEAKDTIGKFPLSKLMLPGTHNSGSYQEYRGKVSNNILTRFKVCQDEDIWNQLIYGIRHFDLRIGYYYDNREAYWLNHDYIKLNPFGVALEQIKRFISQTNEIVILDFHRFPVGFRSQPEHHRHFIKYLTKELGDFMIPRSYGYYVPLNLLWSRDQRILVAYSNEVFEESELLWPGLPQVWASTDKINKLKQHLQTFMQYKTPPLWAAMAELTPTMWLALRTFGSLRSMADAVNHNVTKWFRDEWWQKANIVATDFFHGNNLVDVSIESNQKRKWCQDGQATTPMNLVVKENLTTPDGKHESAENGTLNGTSISLEPITVPHQLRVYTLYNLKDPTEMLNKSTVIH